jgi:organic hydroperoxide reductase OsmC/OhrA
VAHNEHHYTGSIVWTGVAAGPTKSYQSYSRAWQMDFAGKPPMIGSADPAFRGNPALHNPEELLLAALASCHMLSFLALCSLKKIEVTSYSDKSEATMKRLADGQTAFVSVKLYPLVTISDASKLDAAIALHEGAHKECFIANSVNFPVENFPTVTVG